MSKRVTIAEIQSRLDEALADKEAFSRRAYSNECKIESLEKEIGGLQRDLQMVRTERDKAYGLIEGWRELLEMEPPRDQYGNREYP